MEPLFCPQWKDCRVFKVRLQGLGDPQSRPPASGSTTCSSVNLLSKRRWCGVCTLCILFCCTLSCNLAVPSLAPVGLGKKVICYTIWLVLPECALFSLDIPPSSHSLKTHLRKWPVWLLCKFSAGGRLSGFHCQKLSTCPRCSLLIAPRLLGFSSTPLL